MAGRRTGLKGKWAEYISKVPAHCLFYQTSCWPSWWAWLEAKIPDHAKTVKDCSWENWSNNVPWTKNSTFFCTTFKELPVLILNKIIWEENIFLFSGIVQMEQNFQKPFNSSLSHYSIIIFFLLIMRWFYPHITIINVHIGPAEVKWTSRRKIG